MQAYIYFSVSFSYYFSFFMSKSNRMEPKKCHWWNLKSQGLGWGKPVALASHPHQKDENDD